MCCNSDTLPPPETTELQFGKLTQRKFDCQEYFFLFFQKHLLSVFMCTQEVGADTQTSVLADDQRPEQRWQQDREKQGGDTQMSSQLQNC